MKTVTVTGVIYKTEQRAWLFRYKLDRLIRIGLMQDMGRNWELGTKLIYDMPDSITQEVLERFNV